MIAPRPEEAPVTIAAWPSSRRSGAEVPPAASPGDGGDQVGDGGDDPGAGGADDAGGVAVVLGGGLTDEHAAAPRG